MTKKNRGWTIGILIGVIVALVIIVGFMLISPNNPKSSQNIPFESKCIFGLTGGQFSGYMEGEDKITCRFRNVGSEPAEKCFNIKEVKIDGAIETTLAQYNNICSGILNPYEWSEEKDIFEPKTYDLFDESDCAILSQNEDKWSCSIRSQDREIVYVVKAEEI